MEEPQQLPILETFPAVFAAIDASRFTHRSLEDFDRSYAYGMDGANYGWFQSQFHVTAKEVYDTRGIATLTGIWHVLGSGTVHDLGGLLAEHVGPPAADLPRKLGTTSSDGSLQEITE